MAELESSLTAMDWLHRLKVGGAMVGATLGGTTVGLDPLSRSPGGQLALRKAPNSPLDITATYESQGQQKDGKPPYSYANLITFAINSSAKKKMTLSEIYLWICENFPYYKEAGNGWKVSLLLLFFYFHSHLSVSVLIPVTAVSVSVRIIWHLSEWKSVRSVSITSYFNPSVNFTPSL